MCKPRVPGEKKSLQKASHEVHLRSRKIASLAVEGVFDAAAVGRPPPRGCWAALPLHNTALVHSLGGDSADNAVGSPGRGWCLKATELNRAVTGNGMDWCGEVQVKDVELECTALRPISIFDFAPSVLEGRDPIRCSSTARSAASELCIADRDSVAFAFKARVRGPCTRRSRQDLIAGVRLRSQRP